MMPCAASARLAGQLHDLPDLTFADVLICGMQVPANAAQQQSMGYHAFHCYLSTLLSQFQSYLSLDHANGIESAAVIWGSAPSLVSTRKRTLASQHLHWLLLLLPEGATLHNWQLATLGCSMHDPDCSRPDMPSHTEMYNCQVQQKLLQQKL